MAEIKSTWEKVLERLETMESGAPGDLENEERQKRGMKAAAEFLSNSPVSLVETLEAEPEVKRKYLQRGMVTTLLRNIVLPRYEDQDRAEKAMHGLLEVGGGSHDLVQILSEMKQILDRYREHREQLRQQLETALRQQLEQAMAQQQGGQAGQRLDPTMHPKYAEEWQRLQGELNGQYAHALGQYKDEISRRLGGRENGS